MSSPTWGARPLRRMPASALLAACALAALLVAPAWAHHGPGFSAGARSVPTGEVLERGRVSFSVRYEQTEYEKLSEEAFIERAREAHTLELLERGLLISPTLTAGVAPGVEVSATIGYFRAVGARERALDPHSGETALFRFDPDGFTDLWLNGKIAVHGGERHHLTLQGGVKAPTGRRSVDVEILEGNVEGVEKTASPNHAPQATTLPIGSGSWDGLIGFGFTAWPSDRLAIDTGAHFVVRTEADDVRLGNRFDGGVIATYRLSRDGARSPRISLFAQTAVQSIAMNRVEGETDESSGGTTLFVSPGARFDIGARTALWIAPQFPVAQDVNGDQVESRFRLITEFVSYF